ncbi:MAG: hypothetical protein M1827_007092 [Pycnora praestabilis]|nr:MAG: hypothetical protein M1827_007092 [Pycnora praestabilis]
MAGNVSSAPVIAGIHHLTIPISNIGVSLAWYQNVMGATHEAQYDHDDATTGQPYSSTISVPGMGRTLIELRVDVTQSANQQMWDPVTLGVETLEDLETWGDWLNELNVSRSPLYVSSQGWIIVFMDPDRHFLRIYTYETHSANVSSSQDPFWLGDQNPTGSS